MWVTQLQLQPNHSWKGGPIFDVNFFSLDYFILDQVDVVHQEIFFIAGIAMVHGPIRLIRAYFSKRDERPFCQLVMRRNKTNPYFRFTKLIDII